MSLPLYNVAPDPTSGDDTATLQAAIDATPDGGTLLLPPQACYRVSTLSLFNRQALSILTTGTPSARSQTQRGGELLWIGPAGSDSVISMNGSRDCTLRLSISCDQPNPPACAVRMDRWQDAVKGWPANICTRNTLTGCVIIPPAAQSQTWAGVDIARTSPNNCEFMRLEECIFSPVKSTVGWGSAVVNGPFSNAKSQIFRRLSITGATRGVWLRNGSALIESCTGDSNAVDVQIDGFADPVAIRGCNFEHSGLAISTPYPGGLQNAPLVIEGNRWTISGGTCFNLACKMQVVRDNELLNNNAAPAQPFSQNQGAFACQCSGNVWGGKWQSTLWQGSNVTQGQAPTVDWNRGY